jgi:hypothetical protein
VEDGMKRALVAILAAVLAIGAAVSDVEAQKKKGGKGAAKGKGKAAAAAAPNSDKIAESMGKLKWGMGRDDVLKDVTEKVKEKYRPLLSKTKDAVEEDRLRLEAKNELEAIKKGVVEFDGRSSGWDVGFLKGEFTHNNDESMIVVRDGNSQNFYFFIGGKLWKWYKAFDTSVFPGSNFNTFASAVKGRFGGEGKETKGEMRPGEGQRRWLEWQDPQTRLRAVDNTGFYGFFCLVFEDKGTVDRLATLRSNTSDSGGKKKHALVEAVTGERSHNPDDAPNIADRISGRIRQHEQAPEGPSDETASTSGKKGKGKAASASEAPVRSSDDPLGGLGL